MSDYIGRNILISTNENTVVSEYKADPQEKYFASEREAEESLINNLQEQGYEWVKIDNKKALENNLRKQIEKLNNLRKKEATEFKFTDNEWDWFFREYIAGEHISIEQKIESIQEDNVKILNRDDGSQKNIYLIDKDHVHNNYLQVINQYREKEGNHNCRYDVTILVNGFPLVHIELKKKDVDIKSAFDQIKRYQENSFFAGNGLFEYIQIFIISNTQDTKYYSSSTRLESINRSNKTEFKKNKSGFVFTNYWTSKKHEKIKNLEDFAKHFLNKKNLLNILTKYCVFTTYKKLVVMRPYQIDAVESIINRINLAINNKWEGKTKGGGFIWHATGSGKTLTSFKAAQLISKIGDIEKVLFVVDRKALDHQTVAEYQKYGGDLTTDAASTAILLSKLKDSKSKIIVTSINKLSRICKQNKDLEIFNKRVVLIFDECHRSQFGEMHNYITKAFKKYHIFGFTGTPIFTANSIDPDRKTTEHYFGDQLNAYTLVNAISDKNVLKFRLSYLEREGKMILDQKVDYVLEHFNDMTKNSKFNSILAADSIEEAIKYYDNFKKKLGKRDLKIASIFSPEEKHNEQLIRIINNYNEAFGTNFNIENFDNYRTSISKKVKDREIDLLIVADMFLTGFDAPTLNTLWLDKPKIRDHNLIQAFSRTNRIYDQIKDTGNIISFNNIKQAMDEALELFGYEENDKRIIIENNFNEQYEIYKREVEKLKKEFPLNKDCATTEEKKKFIMAWNSIEPQINKLSSYDEFKDQELINNEERDNYRGRYLKYAEEFKKPKKDNKAKEIEEEITISLSALDFIKHVEVNVDYILWLISKKESKEVIQRLVNASPDYRDKWDLIEEFIDGNKDSEDVHEAWRKFIENKMTMEVKEIIDEYKLTKPEEVQRVVKERNLEKINKGPWMEENMEKISLFDDGKYEKIKKLRDKLTLIIFKYRKIS
ncbi:hypothetical protein A6V39_05380 [Candidatus Mycoplasma haematobovis]|uniref:Type I restriction enzyme endonuclease subunit n=1 Tax=Candidatus Mycoplasma haematobovis TaxID=432608 RepID=A0A1A9QBD0_9MOLU|nr:type I restriction endonuclease subunit R [Candidatus Mycoplasma haematobovis]OAL09767.1 hypothetical protein A6V39_05380 [Candidatus Mycoplasma haematobovis]